MVWKCGGEAQTPKQLQAVRQIYVLFPLPIFSRRRRYDVRSELTCNGWHVLHLRLSLHWLELSAGYNVGFRCGWLPTRRCVERTRARYERFNFPAQCEKYGFDAAFKMLHGLE